MNWFPGYAYFDFCNVENFYANPTSRDAHPLAINAFGLATGHSTLKAIVIIIARIGIKQVETA